LRSLRIYSLLNNLASGLTSPFIGFLVASSGIPVYLLSIVSSASTSLPGIAQIAILRIRSNSRSMVFLGTLAIGLLWILSGFVSYASTLFVGLYLVIQVISGIASLGWLLILENISRGRRGFELARYSFYASAGSLLATLITGYIVGRNLSNMGYFFIATGILLIVSSLAVLGYRESDSSIGGARPKEESFHRTSKSADLLSRFYIINSAYMVVMSFAWPLFPLAQVYKFRMSAAEVGILTVIAGMSSLAIQRPLGILVDINRKAVMVLGRVLLASFPLGYAFSPNIYYLYAIQIISGFTNSAGIAYTSYVMDHSIDKRRALSMFNFLNGIATIIGSIMGGLLYVVISSAEDPVAAIDILMTSIGIIRILMAIPYIFLRDPR
jgi:MFS family permease